MTRYLKISDAAELAGMCPNTIRKLTDEGMVAAGRTPGGHRRIDRDSLIEYLHADHFRGELFSIDTEPIT